MPYLTKYEVIMLTEDARKGDKNATDKLYTAYYKALFGFILARIIGGKEDAENLTHDVWNNILETIEDSIEEGGYDPDKAGFYTYVIRRFAIPHIKQHNGEIIDSGVIPWEIKEPGDDSELREYESDTPGPDLEYIYMELHRRNLAVFREVFRLTILCGGYPHQLMAYGLSKQIMGTKSPRGVEGSPAKVDSEYGKITLKRLVDIYWELYKTHSGIENEEINELRKYLDPLYQRLPLEVKLLLGKLSKDQLKHLTGILMEIVESTCLRDYYSERGYSASISDWCKKVEYKVRDVIGLTDEMTPDDAWDFIEEGLIDGSMEPLGCYRCKLRHVCEYIK